MEYITLESLLTARCTGERAVSVEEALVGQDGAIRYWIGMAYSDAEIEEMARVRGFDMTKVPGSIKTWREGGGDE